MYYFRVENNRVVERTTENMQDKEGWILVTDPKLYQARIVVVDQETGELRPLTDQELELEDQQLQQKAFETSVRLQRNLVLEQSDKYMLLDRLDKFTKTQQQAILAYRQQLRDLPKQPGFPETVVWPTLNLNANT